MEYDINLFIRLISQLISTVIAEPVEKSIERLHDVHSLGDALNRIGYDLFCTFAVAGL